MKVYQLIDELKKVDQNLDVVVSGYEGGTSPLKRENIELKYVDTEDGMPYCGEYGDAEDSEVGMAKPLLVILLRR